MFIQPEREEVTLGEFSITKASGDKNSLKMIIPSLLSWVCGKGELLCLFSATIPREKLCWGRYKRGTFFGAGAKESLELGTV